MGLYEPWQLNVDWERLRAPVLIIAGIVLVALVVWNALSWVQPEPLQVHLSGFINLATTLDGFPIQPNSELEITVHNPFPEPVHNVSVFVRPQDEKALIVSPPSTKIKTLDRSRSLRVIIRPNPAERVLSGIYLVDVTALIGAQTFSKQIEVEIRNPEAQ